MTSQPDEPPEFHFGLPVLPEEFLLDGEGVEMDPAWELFPEEAALLEASYRYRPPEDTDLEAAWDEMLAAMSSAGLDFRPSRLDGAELDPDDPEAMFLEAAIFLEEHWEEL
jgi:hypothetical protein